MPPPTPDPTPPAVAAAPCSFGVYRLEPGLPDPDALLAAMRAGGYAGTDLGPVGYFGTGRDLRERLARHELALAGGWIEVPADDTALATVDEALDAFDAAGPPAGDLPAARPTLAVEGPGEPIAGRPVHLDEEAWDAMVARVGRAAGRCRERGYEPTFHHHVGTWVETPASVDRLLADCDVDLCFDTGHWLLGGGDPAADLPARRDRVNHVHLKDVDDRTAAALAREQAPLWEIWRSGAFRELGAGALDIDGILAVLSGYRGWIVVEQDRVVPEDGALDEPAAAQARSRTYLRERGW